MSVKYFDKEQNKWVIFPGTMGAPGKDAYDIAVEHGYKGTYDEYVDMISKMPGYIEDIEGIIDGSGAFVKAEGDINEDHLAVFKDNNTIKDGGITIKDVIDKVVNGLEGDLIDPSMLSASVENVVETDGEVLASVNYEDKNFAFSFGIPKGIKGDKGDKGDTGESGVSARTVLAFTTSDTKPARPVGGSWDILTNEVTLPSGWSMSDEIAKPVWMCSGVFYNADPDNPVWGDTSLISGTDGDNGADGTSIEFIYKLTPDHTNIYKPERPTQNTQTDVAPEGWTDSPSGISEEMQCEWFCTRKWSDNGWSDWDGPYIWSKWGANGLDGDGVQYVYYLNDGEPVNNPTISDYVTNDAYQERGAYDGVEYCPASPWTDEPSGVTPDNKCEWVSVRKFRDGKWGPYSDPKLWARYGESGVSGLISRSKYAITDSSSVVPAFNKNEKNPGSIWYSTLESAMAHYEYPQAMWSITAYFDRNNDFAEFVDENGNSVIGWQGPIIISGTKGDQGPIGPQGIQGEAGATGPEGPNGPMGVAGVGMEFRYCRGTADAPEYPSVEDITYGTDSKDNGKATPDGWHWNTENMVLEGDYLYVWCIQGKKKYNDDKDNYSIDWQAAFRLSGLNGSEKGDQGEAGPVVYPAGYWNENQIYEIKDGLCPYVYYEGNFYILNATPSTGHNPEEYPKIWVKMESFEAIYADVGVFKQALVGSAVFHGDYVYSQQGINGTNYTDSKVSDVDGKPSDFTPNILFNFKTGAGHLAGGKIEFTSDGSLNFGQGVLPEGGSGGSGDVTDYDRIQDMIDDSIPDTSNFVTSDDIDGFITIDDVTSTLNKTLDEKNFVNASEMADAIDGITAGKIDSYNSELVQKFLNGKITINGISIGDDTIAASAIVANDGLFQKIIANDATVQNLMAEKISGSALKQMSIMSGDTQTNSDWYINSDGTFQFADGKILYDGDKLIISSDGLSGEDIYDAEAHAKIANLNSLLNTLNGQVDGLEGDINDLNTDIANAEANAIADAESKLAAYKTEAANNLAKAKSELKTKIDDAETNITKVDEMLLGITTIDGDKIEIDGSKIKARSIQSNSIATEAINTAHIQGSELLGLTVKSSQTNPAWEINNDGSAKFAKGNVKFYANGNVEFGEGVSISWNSDQQKQVNNAIDKANQAIADAADAQSSADTANSNASKAQSTANSASTKADNAQNAANTASTKANSAIDLAEAAQTAATRAEAAAATANAGIGTTNSAVEALKTRMSTAESDLREKFNASDLTEENIVGLLTGAHKINGQYISDHSISTEQISSNYVYAGEIAANKISGGTLNSDVIYTGTINASKITTGDFVGKDSTGRRGFALYANNGTAEFGLQTSYPTYFYGGSGQVAGGLISWTEADGVKFKNINGVSIASKANLTSLQETLTQSINNKATVDDVMKKLQSAVADGETKINGGWIDTNAITIRPSQLVDDSNNPVTIITPETLATTNVIAKNLQVNAANISGTLDANKVNATNLSVKEAATISGTIMADKVMINDSELGYVDIYTYINNMYKKNNYDTDIVSTWYEYVIENVSVYSDSKYGSTRATLYLDSSDEEMYISAYAKKYVHTIHVVYTDGVPSYTDKGITESTSILKVSGCSASTNGTDTLYITPNQSCSLSLWSEDGGKAIVDISVN